MRGSDPDTAIYLGRARMLEAGEDPQLHRPSYSYPGQSEDIGNADPRAIIGCGGIEIVEKVGMPEAQHNSCSGRYLHGNCAQKATPSAVAI